MFAKQVEVDAWFVVEPFKEAGGHELDQVVVALKILAKQNQVIASPRSWFEIVAIFAGRSGFFTAIQPAALRDINFTANDWLYVALTRLVEEIRGGEQVAVVGDGHRRHLLSRCFVQ